MESNMTIHLLVKGDKFTAAKVAAERGIPFKVVREHRYHFETFGETDGAHRRAVVEWFCDGNDRSPFPIGTLLLYTEAGAP
jgi:hypothetical protein